MRRSKTTRLVFAALFLFAALALTSTPALAACEAAIHAARAEEGKNTISVSFATALSSADVILINDPNNFSRWILNDFDTPPSGVSILSVRPDPLNDPRVTDVLITLSGPLTKGHRYQIVAPHLTCSDGGLPTAIVKLIAPLSTVTPTTRPASTDFFAKSKAKGRNDSNVYLAGSIEGASGSGPQISADIKVESPSRVNLGIFKRVGPYFDLKASTSEKADANTLKFGGKLSAPFNVSSSFLGGIVWETIGGFESDRRFDNVNTILDNRLYFAPGGLGNNATLYLQPFIGFELGRNLKSPVAEAEDRTLARGMVGASLYIDLYPKKTGAIFLQTDYIRRFLLKREISFKEDKDSGLLALEVGKGARDYLQTAIEFEISDFTGIKLGYEYGSLPPNFQLVDHKYSISLVHKFKTKFGVK